MIGKKQNHLFQWLEVSSRFLRYSWKQSPGHFQGIIIFCFLLALILPNQVNAVTIGSQDFESSPAAPTLTFSASGGGFQTGSSGSGDRPASVPYYSGGARAYQVNNGTATLTFDTTNVTGYTDIRLSLRLAAWSIASVNNGMEVADYVQIQLSTNSGTTYITQTAVSGHPTTANSYWEYVTGIATGIATFINTGTAVTNRPGGGGSRTTDGYTTLIVTNIPASSTLRIRIIMLNNAAGERWTIDDLVLTGESAACSPNAVTLVQQTGNYITWADSGGVFNQGSDQMGMYANGGGAKQVVAWRDFRTDGSGGGSQRDLQPGDRFRISLQGTSPFGILGVSVNDTNATTSGWNNRTNSTRGYIQCGNSFGDLYVTHGGGTPSWAGVTPVNQVTIVFDVLSSAEFTANIEGQTAKYDLTMLNNPGFDDRISGFSLYYNDDWNGTRNSNAYWRQTTLVTNLGVIQLGGDNGTRNIVGKITDGSSPGCVASTSTNVVRKTGTGTITLQHTTNTYSGGTRIETGTLAVFADGNLGAVPATATNNIDIWNTGIFRATNTFTLNANRTIQLGNVNGPTNSVATGHTLTYGGIFGGDADWNKLGGGVLALTGTSSTNKGKVSIQAGTLRISGDGSLGAVPGSAVEKINIWDQGTFEADGTFTLHANRSIEVGTVSGPKLSVTSGNTLTYGGAISGSANWTKESAGRLTLNGYGTASGTLTVNAGEVIQNATNTSMGLSVTSSTFAYGYGVVNALTLSGLFSPGIASNTVGNFYSTSLNLQNNGRLQVDFSAMIGAAGTDWDVINVGGGSGTYTVNAVDGSDFVIALKGSPTFDNTVGYTNIIINAGTASSFVSNKFTIVTDEFTPDLNSGTFTVDAVGGDLRLIFKPSAITTIASQGFEGSANDSWNYTFSAGIASIYVDGDTNASGNYALTLAGSNNLNTDPYVEFDTMDVRGFTAVSLKIAFAAAGPDSGDNLHLDVSHDNGATWTGPGSTTLVSGVSNTNIGFTATSAVTVGANPWSVTLPATSALVKVRVRFDESANDNSFDRYFIDDIRLSGIGTLPTASFGSQTYYTTETNITLTVPVNISSAADATVRVSLAGTALVGGGNDYTVNSTNIIFKSGGSTTSNLVFTINNDAAAEGIEDIQLRLVMGIGLNPAAPGIASVLIQDDDSFTVMSANLTAGTNIVDGTFAYDESAMRIIKRLRPDVLAIQEWKITNASYRAFVDEILGPEYEFYLEPEGDANPIPNGVISRWPIVASNEWSDTYVGARDYVHAKINLPGPADLNVVSVHFKAGAPDAATRLNEARELTNYIATAGFLSTDFLVIAGDLNVTGRTETTFRVITQIVTDAHSPADQNGNLNSNLGRGSPYDHVLPNNLLDAQYLGLNVAGFNYTNGMIFDSEQFSDHLLPALVKDSYTTNRTHLAVMKLFNLSTASVPPTVTTTIASATNTTTAATGGNVVSDGGASVTNRGVVWSTSATPTVPGIQSTNGTGTGSFSSTMTNLTPGQTYYYRAFAQNSVGTGYGTEYSLSTPCFTSVVIGLHASVTNDVNFTATWTAFAGASGYALDVSTNAAFSSGGAFATELIISEYGEGSSNNKWVEIYNGTGASVDLSDYEIWLISNGGSWPETTISLSGTLNHGDTYLVVNSSASGTFTTPADLTSGSLNHNGDDAVGLAKNSALIDAVGEDGADPGTGWAVAGTANATVDGTLIRKSSILSPNTDWDTSRGTDASSSEWILQSQDYSSSLGAHTMDTGSGSGDFVPGYSNRAVAVASTSVTGLTTGVTYYFRVRATNDFCISGNSSTGAVTTILITPGIVVLGNSLVITNGDNSPVVTDHTDFGAVGLAGSNLVRTFTITNNGTSSLSFDNVAVGGTHPSDFTVSAQPSSPVAIGATTTFQVTFDPTAAGTRTATLYITNNVAAKNPYIFDVQGTGVQAVISLAPTNFTRTTMVGSSLSGNSFYITNSGRGQLVYTISTNAGWLSVSPVSATLSETAEQTETITYSVLGLYAGVSNATITITDANAANSPRDVTVQLTLTNIPDPTAVSATADGYEMIRLAWTKRTDHDVMIVHKAGSAPTDPDQGASYAVGAAVGGGSVIYKGTGASLEHIVSTGTDHYYEFYSINNNHYSPGVAFMTNTLTYAISEIVEPVAYTNGVTLVGLSGGNGWSGAWSVGSGTYTVGTSSLSVNTNYPASVANRIQVADPGNGGQPNATRSFAAVTNGNIYVAAIVSYEFQGPYKFAGFSFMSNTTERSFVGKIPNSENNRFGVSRSRLSTDIKTSGVLLGGFNTSTANIFLIIGSYNFATRDLKAISYPYSAAVPLLEPGTWDVTSNMPPDRIGVVDGVRLASGALGAPDGTIGRTRYDEIRVATSWASLIGQFPQPEIEVLGTNRIVIPDGTTTASTANGTDFGSTAVTGGQVDRTLFITNSGQGLLNITGVTTSGAHASDFIIIDYPVAVYPGTVSNFVIRFDPTVAGSRTATIEIANDDTDEAVYDFVVQGTGQVPPTVTTTVANPTNATTATTGGNVTDQGFAAVTDRGVVWDTSPAPTIPGNQSTDGTGGGSYVSTMTSLMPGGTYYYRAFAENSAGVGYGAEYSLVTPCFSGVVTGLYVSVTNDLNFTAVWSNFTGATGYQLDVSTSSNFLTVPSGNYGVEAFTNIGGGTVSSYLTRQWTNNGIAWTSYNSRIDQTIDGSDAITLQNAAGSYLLSQSIAGGVDQLWVTHQLKFTGADSFDIFVNNIKVATNVVYSASVQTVLVQNINISGAFTIMITNKSGGRVALDNLTWTNSSVSQPTYIAGYSNRAVAGISHSVTGLTSGATYYYRVRATNDFCATTDSTTGSVTTVILATDLEILGNGTVIADGDATPSLTDHTDFGNVGLVNSNLVRTFTITNSGPGTLSIYNVTTSGVAAADYLVITAPASTLASGATTTFQVRFDPSALGTRAATIAVSNNSSTGKSTYDFAVQGNGVASGISFSPTNFNLTSVVGSNPSTTGFGVTNVGLGDLIYTISSNVNWLTISPVASTNSETAGRQHTVFFNVSGMGAGVTTGIITIAGATASNSPQTLPIVLTLTAIPEVLAAAVTNDGNEMVRISWTKHASHNVLITHNQTNAPSTPVNGTTYSAGSAIGSDGTRIIYNGSGSSLEHVVPAGSINNYSFYSINNSHYSTGLNTNTTMGTYAAGERVMVFAYTNGTTLAGVRGGQGWGTNVWLGDTNSYSSYIYSFPNINFYPTSRANKVRTTPASGTTTAVRRQFTNTFNSGVIYVSYILNYEFSGPGKFAGLSLMSNATEKLFVGEVSTADERLGFDGVSSNRVLTAGVSNDYVIVMRYSWATGVAVANAYKINNSETLPNSEPTTWEMTLGKASNVVGQINGIRIAAGASSGTPGNTYFDEIRVATSWDDLVLVRPSPVIYDWFAASSGTVDGGSGGTGWSNNWTFGGSAFADYNSGSIPKLLSSYIEPVGNKIVMYGDVDDRDMTIARNFLVPKTNGVVYFSWIQNYEFNGVGKYAGLSLLQNTTEKAFVGKVSGADKSLGVDSSTDNEISGFTLENGSGHDYVIVGKYDFTTRELSATAYETATNAIAEEPHGYWSVTTTQSVGHITSITGVRFALGAGAGAQVGDVYMDEVRVGTNFYEVARRDGEAQSKPMIDGPTPRLLYVGTNYLTANNPQGSLANITVTDADLANASNPLDIAVMWTNSYGVFMTNFNSSILNFGSRAGRVSPNYDPVVLSGSEFLSVGFDSVFTNFVGFNGAGAVTTYVHGAFSITNSSISNTYYITMSAENNNQNGGGFTAPNGADNIPYHRALTINTALQFYVDDDDPILPSYYEYTINGDGGFGDTNITAGGIAIIGVNGAPDTNMNERFSFVVLRPFPIGTIIDFVDCGWDPNGNDWHRLTEFHTNRWVSPGNASVGQVIELELQDINNSGDQVVVYQYNGGLTATNDSGNVSFIYAVNLDADGDGWDVNPIPPDNEHSGLYRGLTNGISAVSVPLRSYRANAYYTGDVVGTASDLLLSIGNSNNWYVVPSSSATNLTLTNYNFTITGSGTIDWTLASISDHDALNGGYVITNIAQDEYSGLVATNTSFASAPYFMMFNTNNAAVASNGFPVTFANGANGIQTMVMTGPPGNYPQVTIGTVSSFVYVADMDNDRQNDFLDNRFSMPVYIYDDDASPPLVGTNLVTMMLGETALGTTNRAERLAAWNFNDSNDSVDYGVGIFTNNLSSAISYASSGTTLNAVTNDVAGNDITISGTANIGRYLQFQVDMTGHRDLVLSMAAQRSAVGYNSNTISYAVNGGAPVVFLQNWNPTTSYSLESFDFSAIAAVNNATSVSIFITFGTNAVTGGGNNRFDNIQLNANVIRYYEVTDAALALVNSTNALNFSFNVYDTYSGVSRGTGNTGTNMLINIDGFATNDTASYNAALSSAASLTSGSTSMWSFANTISYVRRGELYADGQSNRTILATLADLDNDRLGDTLWSSNSFFGKFRVIDDDPNPPVLVDISYGVGTLNNRPFYVATNGYSPGSSELIRGNYARRSGTGSNSVFAVTDADLARSGTDNMQLVFGVNDIYSGIGRGTSGSSNTVMSFSIVGVITNNIANFNSGISTASSGTNVLQSNIWTFANGFFTDSMMNSMIAASSNRVTVTVPDLDNDRTNDTAMLTSAQVGWLQVYDDDIKGPTMTLVDIVGIPGAGTVLATSFETSQGWPISTTGYLVSTNWSVTDAFGTWYGSGAQYTSLQNKPTGTRRLGLLTNTNAPNEQYIQLPPIDDPGVLTVYAARFSGADTTLRVDRANSVGSWVSVAEYAITNIESDLFMSYSYNINYTGNDVTLRVVRVGSTGPQVSLDDILVSSSPSWISTNSLLIQWAEAIEDFSAVDYYRLVKPAIGTAVPVSTNTGTQLGSSITSSVQSILGEQGVLTGFVFAVDNDSDRSLDSAMGNIISVVVKVDTNPPPAVSDFVGSNNPGDVSDTTSQIKLTWTSKSTSGEAAGWRQNDSQPLSPFVSYRVYYTENTGVDPTYSDTYYDSSSAYTDLGTYSTTEITVDGLIAGYTYHLSMAGVDEAGNVGPMSDVAIVTLDIFGVTYAFANEERHTVIQWEGRDDSYFDVIYADSTGYTDHVNTMWELAQTIQGTQFVDEGGADAGSNNERLPPNQLPANWMRFYRVSPVNAWVPSQNRDGVASEEVIVAHVVSLAASNNFIGISMLPYVDTVAGLMGTSRLFAGMSMDESSRLNLYSVTQTGDPDSNTLWLSSTEGWLTEMNVDANTNTLPFPHKGFDLYVPQVTNFLMVGRVPYTNTPMIQIETQAYNVLSMNLPRPTKVSDLGIRNLLTWGMNIGEADEVRIMNKGTAPWGQPRGRVYVNTNGIYRFANGASAENFVIQADEAIIIYSKALQTPIYIDWAGTNYYPKPTILISSTITAAPTTKALSALIVNTTNATLRGTVNPNHLVTATWFQYGTTTNYGTVLSSINLPGTNVAVNVSTNIYGLIPGARYYFQVVASNSMGLSRFGTGSFTIGGGPDNMVYVPDYSFTMGATTNIGDESNANELPQHTVTIDSFYMDKYEVTASLWSNVYEWAITNGYGFSTDGTGKDSDHPIVTINWYDAVKWCNARSQYEGRTPVYYTSGTHSPANIYKSGSTDIQTGWVNWTNSAYRLPTEAEWERAARGGIGDTRFPWTDYTNNISHVKANFDNDGGEGYQVGTTGNHPTYGSGGFPYTSPVGSFGANAAGLYDMAGNVREMCWDWYDAAYYASSPGTDPRGAGSGTVRVNRGSGWDVNAAGSRIAARHSSAFPNQANNNRGFRTVISAP